MVTPIELIKQALTVRSVRACFSLSMKTLFSVQGNAFRGARPEAVVSGIMLPQESPLSLPSQEQQLLINFVLVKIHLKMQK